MTRDEGAKALYEAYNAGGDPDTANKNYCGEPCPEWADLPANIREKWAAAFDASLIITVDAAFDDDCDDQSDTTWSIQWPNPLDYVPRHPSGPLSNFIITENLAGLDWRFGDHSEDIFAELADGIVLYAECEGEPRVTVVADGDPDDDASTAADVLAFLNSVADTGTRCGEDVDYPTDDYRNAVIVLSQAMKKTADLRASRAAP